MNTKLKNVFTILLVVLLSSLVAVAATSFLLKNNSKSDQSEIVNRAMISDGVFEQPVRAAAIAAAPGSLDFTEVAEASVHAVVHIKSVINPTRGGGSQSVDPFELFFGFRFQRPDPQPKVGAGSGVIISTDGYIITNNHVIDGANELEVTLNDNRKYPAKVIGADPTTDVALVKIEEKNLPTIPFGDSEKLKVGEWVLAIGNPFNLRSTVTAGIVSAKGRSIPTMGASGRDKIESFIQTDAAVNPGNSGGALINTKGELVGINTAIYSETGNFAGYSFAVPINIAGKVVADLKEYGVVQRAVLGVIMSDIENIEEEAKKNVKVTEGAYVHDFAERSSAKEAGMEKGDVIVSINDNKIKSASVLQEQISKYRPGDKVKVKVNRNGSEKTFTVELRNAQGNTDMRTKQESADILGGVFKVLSDKQKQQYGVGYGIEATAINKGKLRDAGIQKGFIVLTANEGKIETVEDFYTIVDDIRIGRSEGDPILVIKGFYPNGRTRYYAIDLSE